MFLWKSNVTPRLIAAESETDAIAVLVEEFGPCVSTKRTAVVTRHRGEVLLSTDELDRYVDEHEAIRLLATKRGLVDEP